MSLMATSWTSRAGKPSPASLDLSVHRMASAYALLSCGVWTSILDSIFYESLYGIGNAVLKGTYHKPPRRIHFRIKAEKNEETV